jgi:hypothetical protein
MRFARFKNWDLQQPTNQEFRIIFFCTVDAFHVADFCQKRFYNSRKLKRENLVLCYYQMGLS